MNNMAVFGPKRPLLSIATYPANLARQYLDLARRYLNLAK